MRCWVDYCLYLLLRVTWSLARRVPPTPLRRTLQAIGSLLFWVDRRHRRAALETIAVAFPELDAAERLRLARTTFRNWGRIAAEVVHADRIPANQVGPLLGRLHTRTDALREGGRGVLALTAHTGNFELLVRLLGRELGGGVVLFHRRMSNRYIDAFLTRQREAFGVRTLGRGIVVREALRALDRGDVLVVPLDQNQSRRRGVFVDFFGRPASTSTMLARISLATGVVVQPAFAVWAGERVDAVLGDPIPPAVVHGATERRRAIVALTQRYTQEIEAVVRAHPQQWNWTHRRWKTRPSATAGRQRPGAGEDRPRRPTINRSHSKRGLPI